MVTLQAVVTLVGRIFIAIPCMIIGIALIIYWDNYTAVLEQQELPVITLFMVLAIILLLVGGLAVVLGWWARIGAVLIMIPLFAAMFAVSRFWDPTTIQETASLWGVWDNLAVIGGLIYILAFGSGKISFDRRGKAG